jgi:fructose-1,6-bisphosphatase I
MTMGSDDGDWRSLLFSPPNVNVASFASRRFVVAMMDSSSHQNGDVPVPRWACPDHSDVCSETGITLSRHMAEIARANPGQLDDIVSIFTSIQTATKTISKLVRQSALTGITGLEGGGGSINVQGEEQKKLDVIANDVIKKTLKWTGKFGTLASEEDDLPVMLDNMGRKVYSNQIVVEEEGQYVAVFDPLDGSSNVDAGIATGSIFGIYYLQDQRRVPPGL